MSQGSTRLNFSNSTTDTWKRPHRRTWSTAGALGTADAGPVGRLPRSLARARGPSPAAESSACVCTGRGQRRACTRVDSPFPHTTWDTGTVSPWSFSKTWLPRTRGAHPTVIRPCPVGTQFVVTTMVGGVLVFGGLRSELPLNALQCPGQPHREWPSPSARSAGLMTALVTMAPWQGADWPGSRESPGGVSVPGLVVLRGASRSTLSDTSGRVFVQAGPSPRRPQTCHVVIGPHAGHRRFRGTSAPCVFNQNIPGLLSSLASSKNLFSQAF